MKRYAILLLFVLAISSCKKFDDLDTTKQVEVTDDDAIKAYLSAQNITTAVKDASGLYYNITKQGTGNFPISTSKVTVTYTGYLLNGTLIDRQNNAAVDLSNMIEGWQIGLPFLKTGGHIVLYVPSALAYGSSSPGPNVPANAILIFNIDLISIN